MMNKKNKKIIIDIATLVLVVIGLSCFIRYENSLSRWKEYAISQVDARYNFPGGYEIKSIQKEEEYVLLKIVTNDKYHIEFETKVYWGYMNTPMGPTIFIKRIYIDDFLKCIEGYIIGEEVYDITNKDTEDILTYMLEKRQLAKILYRYYDLMFMPDLKFKLKFNGKVFEIGYYSSGDKLKKAIQEKIFK